MPTSRNVPDGAPRRLGGASKPVIVAGLATAVLLGGLYGWRTVRAAPAAPPPAQALPVVATVVTASDAPAALEAVGSLRAVRQVVLSPETAGRVVAIHFDAGTRVGAGAPLVQLYDEPERADRAAAQARAELARLRHERSVTLMPTGAEPRDRLEERRADLDQARANVRQLDARIVQKRISAPFAGELGVRKVDLGQYLNPGDPIATLTDLDTLYVDFTVPQQELARLKIGGQVRLTADAWPGKVFVATVNAVEPRVSENTRNVAVQARLPNAGRILRPGMYVAVALELPPEKGALLVPATAIQTSAAGESVTVIRGANAAKGGKAEIVPVTPGRRIGDRVAVVRGLKAGDVVITEGQLRVQPGAAVQVSKLLAAKG